MTRKQRRNSEKEEKKKNNMRAWTREKLPENKMVGDDQEAGTWLSGEAECVALRTRPGEEGESEWRDAKVDPPSEMKIKWKIELENWNYIYCESQIATYT